MTPFVVALILLAVGVAVYVAPVPAKIAEIGRLLFLAAVLALFLSPHVRWP